MHSSERNGLPPSLHVVDRVAHLTLRRPHLRNRLHADDVSLLRHLFARVDQDAEVRALVLSAQGNVFCAGYDLDDLGRRSGVLASDQPAAPPPDFASLTVELENLRVPTVCRLNGPVYGGGTDLALSCDFRVGMPDCEMFMPASRLGLHYYTVGLERWVARLGHNAAKKLFLTSSTISAAEMLKVGFLTDLAEDEQQLDERVRTLVGTLLSQAPRAVEGMKRALNQISYGQLDRIAADARHLMSMSSRDLREGMAAWQERRPPVFVGE